MEKDKIKEAFSRIKQDMSFLNYEITQIKQDINKIKQFLDDFSTSTLRQINPTHPMNPTDNPTHPQEIEGLKYQNIDISIGNEGVPTDRQTDRQTDKNTENYVFDPSFMIKTTPKKIDNPIQSAAEILDSLDSIKKEIRLKFKRLTEQELLVFSTIYQLDEENGFADYKSISKKLNLTESSIRDYISRLINKGIPVDKKKINNKTIHLFVSKDLKKLAPLSTILQLRDL